MVSATVNYLLLAPGPLPASALGSLLAPERQGDRGGVAIRVGSIVERERERESGAKDRARQVAYDLRRGRRCRRRDGLNEELTENVSDDSLERDEQAAGNGKWERAAAVTTGEGRGEGARKTTTRVR